MAGDGRVGIKLERLAPGQPITTKDGSATLPFAVTWQKLVEQIEAAYTSLADQLAAIQAAQDAADAANAAAAAADAAAATAQTSADTANTAAATAQTSATTANTAATTAQTTATAITLAQELANSYVSGATITATDAGANVTIAISGHTRYYPHADGTTTSVSVTGGSLTGLAYSTKYYIYYDQASRAGGAVTYASTTSATTAAQIEPRHVVGSVMTPAAAGAPLTGGYVLPPGAYAIYI
jgi:hypothetical protein